MYSLDLRVGFASSITEITADTASLDTTKGNARVATLTAIDLNHPSLDFCCDAVSPF